MLNIVFVRKDAELYVLDGPFIHIHTLQMKKDIGIDAHGIKLVG
jgi:hypothetical protein